MGSGSYWIFRSSVEMGAVWVLVTGGFAARSVCGSLVVITYPWGAFDGLRYVLEDMELVQWN